MFKKSLLLMMLLTLFGVARAQSELTVYEGTVTNNVVPAYIFYFDDFTRAQHVIPAEDLIDMNGGTITSIKYYTTASNVPYTAVSSARVYLMEVDYTTMTALEPFENGTVVFEGYFDVVSEGDGGSLTIDFDTPYTYTGGNLLVGIDNTTDTGYKSINFYGQTVTGASWAGYNANSLEGVTGSQRNFIPKTTFTYSSGGAVCEKPDTFTLVEGSITATSAIFNWTGGSGTYNFQYKKSTDENYLNYPTSATAFSLEGLMPGTEYNVRVQSVCGDNVSGWKSITFRTLFGIPLVEEFGTGTPTGWAMYTGLADDVVAGGTLTAATSGWYFGTYNGVFDNHARINIYGTSCNKWLVMPELAMENNVQLQFDMALTAYSGTLGAPQTNGDDDRFIVLINADGAWSILREWNNSGSEYVYNDITCSAEGETVMIDLSAYAGQTIAIAFYGESTVSNADNNLHIDNVSIDYIPTCPKPTNLTLGTPTNHTVQLSWRENGEATQWIVAYKKSDVETFTEKNVTANPYTLTGLNAETSYDVKVRANCGGGDLSAWSEVKSFTTDIACPAPELTLDEVNPVSATISWTGIASNYTLRYREARGFNYNFETAEPWTYDDFPPCTTLDLDKVQCWGFSGESFTNFPFTGSTFAFETQGEGSNLESHSGDIFGLMVCPAGDSPVAANDWFILPEITIEEGDVFSFWGREITTQYGSETINVGVYGTEEGTFSSYLAQGLQISSTTYTQYSYDLSTYVGQTIRLAINYVSQDIFGFMFDDIFVGNPNDNSWDATITNVTSPYTLSGLSPETIYEVEVQAVCGGDDGTSEWSSVSFMTPSACGKPTNLEATDITTNSAVLSWHSYQNSYQVRYRTKASRETYYFNDFNDEEAEGWSIGYWIYGFSDPIYNVPGDSNYFLEMGWTSTEEEPSEATLVSCELPEYESGAYVEFYYFGYQTANTFQVGYSTTTNDLDAFTWEDAIDAPLSTYTKYNKTLAQGVKYVAWKATCSGQGTSVFIDDFGIFGNDIPVGDWVNATAPASATLALTGLEGKTTYEWQVRGVNSSCEGGYTEWSNLEEFQTLDPCQAPTDLAEEVNGTTATLSWDGIVDSYDLRYRTSIDADIYFSEDFASGSLGDWTMVDCHSSSGPGEGYFMFYYTTTPPQYLISPELTLPDEELTLQFYYEAYNSSWPESFKVGYSSTTNDIESFTWGDEVTNITGGGYYVDAIPSDTKYFSVQCTSDDKFYLFVTSFMIYGPITPAGEWVYVNNVTSPYTLSGLAANTPYDWQVSNAGCDKWSEEGWFQTEEQTEITQTIALEANSILWTSFNVDITIQDLKTAIAEALGTTGEATIKSQLQTLTYKRGRWAGQLTELDKTQMYLIKVSSSCEIALEGEPIDAATLTAILTPGVNYLAYPYETNTTPTAFFAGFAIDQDVIKSQTQSSKYNRNRWVGQVNALEAGNGYIYKSAGTSDRPFTFPTLEKAGRGAQNTIATGRIIESTLNSAKLDNNNNKSKSVTNNKTLTDKKFNK